MINQARVTCTDQSMCKQGCRVGIPIHGQLWSQGRRRSARTANGEDGAEDGRVDERLTARYSAKDRVF